MQKKALQRALFALVLITLVVQCKEEPRLKARINRLQGDIQVQSGPSTPRPAVVGDLMLPGDRIISGKDSSVDLLFPGGSVLRLQASSNLTLEELGSRSKLKLETGDLLLGLSKLKANESMQISTPTAIAAVRGTSFAVSTSRNTIAVLTGKVQVQRDGESVTAESMKEVRTDEPKLQTERLSSENAGQLREILEIEGIESLEDFEQMQKNWAGYALENNLDYLPVKKAELPSLEAREK